MSLTFRRTLHVIIAILATLVFAISLSHGKFFLAFVNLILVFANVLMYPGETSARKP